MLRISKKVQLKTGTTGEIISINGDSIAIKLKNGHKRTVSTSDIEAVRTEAQDLKIDDRIENPANGSSERVLSHEVSVSGGFTAFRMTGWEPKIVPSTQEFWKFI